MRTRNWNRLTVLAIAAGAVAVAAGLVALGRVTVDTGSARERGYESGYAAGTADGHAAGLRDGRATQLTQALPADRRQATRDAFDAGYTAGANDVFGGYDGGWGMSTPYAIVLVPGDGGITYRIGSRVELSPGTDYHVCPGSTMLCRGPR